LLTNGFLEGILVKDIVVFQAREEGREVVDLQIHDEIDIVRPLLHPVKRAGDRATKIAEEVVFVKGMESWKHGREQISWLKMPVFPLCEFHAHSRGENRSIVP
jgi:hypothetical protein